jgi:phosphoribosylanthranilate isomerase
MRIGDGLAVKICGLRSPDLAVATAGAGAGLLGFNFAPVSKRRVSREVAQEAIAAVRAAGYSDVAAVGIFVDQPLSEMAEVARACGLDALQLSGDEDAAACRALGDATGLPVIKALRLRESGADDERRAAVYVAGGVAALLVDAPVPGAWGGTGRSWDWGRAAPLARRYPFLLAGGLTPETVGPAVATVRPWGVDVASGVETDGQTDPRKVRDFVRRAREGQGDGRETAGHQGRSPADPADPRSGNALGEGAEIR